MNAHLWHIAFITTLASTSNAADLSTRASQILTSETEYSAGGLQEIVTWATPSISEGPRIEAHFIASETIDRAGKSFKQIVPVESDGNEQAVTYAKGADCVFESFALKTLNEKTFLVRSKRFDPGTTSSPISQALPSRQAVDIYLLTRNAKNFIIKNESGFTYAPTHYFRLLSSHVWVTPVCTDAEVDRVLLDSDNFR